MATPITAAKHTLGTQVWVADPDSADPEDPDFLKLSEAIAPPSVGDTAPLVKVTYSDAIREAYITGRPDGDQPTVRCNLDPTDPGQLAFRYWKAQGQNFQMRVVVPTSPQLILGFEATPLRAAIDPSNIDGQIVLECIYKVNSVIDEAASL